MAQAKRPIPVMLRCRGNRVDRAALRVLITHILEEEKAPPGRGLGLVLGGDRLLRGLNRQWRGMDRSTDVLSFPLGEAPPLPAGQAEPECALLGEIVISLPRCREQAKRAGCVPGTELSRLVIHGVLHVLGHDHEKPAAARRMAPRERRYRAWAARNLLAPRLLLPA